MEVKFDAVELGEPSFGEAPEGLDAVDMHTVALGEFMLAVVDPQMLVVADIDESVVAAPAVGVDDAFQRHLALDDGLQRGFFAIRHDLGIHPAMPLEDAKHRLLERAATAL